MNTEYLSADNGRGSSITSETRSNQWNSLCASLLSGIGARSLKALSMNTKATQRDAEQIAHLDVQYTTNVEKKKTKLHPKEENKKKSFAINSNEVVFRMVRCSLCAPNIFIYFYFHSVSHFKWTIVCVRCRTPTPPPSPSISVVHLAICQQSLLFIHKRLGQKLLVQSAFVCELESLYKREYKHHGIYIVIRRCCHWDKRKTTTYIYLNGTQLGTHSSALLLFSCLMSTVRRFHYFSETTTHNSWKMCIENSVANSSRCANKDTRHFTSHSVHFLLSLLFTHHTPTHTLQWKHTNVLFSRAQLGAGKPHVKRQAIPLGNFQRAYIVKKLRFIMGFIHWQW